MAIIWQMKKNNDTYQIRTAGKSVRLYTNGILHSQYHPQKLLTDSVWDLLGLPALLLRVEKSIRVLVLGVGGGAVFHLLDKLISPQRIVGIDISATHLKLAKQFFNLTKQHYAIYQADAIEWVKAYTGPGFDLVIDDLFMETDKDVQRVIAMDKKWMGQLFRLLEPQGILVANFSKRKEINQAVGLREKLLFTSCLQLTTANCTNYVGAFSREKLLITELKNKIRDHALLGREKVKYRVSRRL